MVIIVTYYQYNGFLFDLHWFQMNNNGTFPNSWSAVGVRLLLGRVGYCGYLCHFTASETHTHMHAHAQR